MRILIFGYFCGMGKFQAVLFDLDGTLIDSERFYFDAWFLILREQFGLTIDFSDWIDHFAGHTMASNLATLQREFQLEVQEGFMQRAIEERYAEADMRTIRLMPFAKEILDELRQADIRIALVTSSYRQTVDLVLGHHGLLNYFEFFVTREKVQHPKPDPEPYLLATEKLSLSKEVIAVIEDTHTGCAAAQRAGLYCLAVSQQAIERQKLEQADELLNDLAEAKKSLLSDS